MIVSGEQKLLRRSKRKKKTKRKDGATENVGASLAMHLQREEAQGENLPLHLHDRILLRVLPSKGTIVRQSRV